MLKSYKITPDQMEWLKWFLIYTDENGMSLTNRIIKKIINSGTYDSNWRDHLNGCVDTYKKHYISRNK